MGSFTELEMQLAFQEDLLKTLEERLTDQQKQIDHLTVVCRHLAEQLDSRDNDVPDAPLADEAPPHY